MGQLDNILTFTQSDVFHTRVADKILKDGPAALWHHTQTVYCTSRDAEKKENKGEIKVLKFLSPSKWGDEL